MTTTDYLRHPNGRGRLFDDAACSRSAYVSKDSVVKDRAVVRDARLEGSCVVSGNARVYGGTFVNCVIAGDVVVAGNVRAVDSVICCRSVSGSPSLKDCHLYDRAEVFDSPTLEGVTLSGSAWVYGNAVLKGFTLGGMARVERGAWHRAPKSYDFGYVSVTEAKGGAMVDCRFRTFEDWAKNGARIARRRAFVVGQLSGELVSDVLSVIREWQNEQGAINDFSIA